MAATTLQTGKHQKLGNMALTATFPFCLVLRTFTEYSYYLFPVRLVTILPYCKDIYGFRESVYLRSIVISCSIPYCCIDARKRTSPHRSLSEHMFLCLEKETDSFPPSQKTHRE